ncbi:uncharacterized protein TNCV_641551 [Trichonephila clavipes]|nr:uncharacterized protein TNCV_641551 [Trichonephila clavipes]
MVWSAIPYHGRSNLLRIQSNLNSNRYVREVLYSPKSFPSFKASLELSFSRIMHTHVLQRLFETSFQPNTCNFFLGLLIRLICRLMSTCEFGWSASRSGSASCSFKRRTFAAQTSNMEFSSTSRHSKSV